MIDHSLHVGLNSVDPASYNNWSGFLNACHNDAAGLAIMASRVGSTAWGLNTSDTEKNLPTIANFKEQVATLADITKPGELAMLSYSGHGGSDQWGESLCLYDGLLYEHELRSLLAKFKEGTRWIFVLDSCHSGGLDRGFMSPAHRAAPRAALRVQDAPKAWPFSEAVIPSSGVLLCACQPAEVAYDGDQFGAWTGSLLRAWPDGTIGHTAQTWFDRAYDYCPETQHPVLRLLGQNHDWLHRAI